MKKLFSIAFISCISFSCSEKSTITSKHNFVIANGQMPSIAKDAKGILHLVYGNGDSLLYTSSDNNGNTFSSPVLLDKIPGLYSFATRGPQITTTSKDIIITACNSEGNIFSYYKENQKWQAGKRVNDADTVSKEGLMALSGEGDKAFAAWLDLRGDKKNKIYGASSVDGGKTWSKNILIYTSPDSSVCECCKPSVIVRGNNVYVMFRNWLNGNRDIYIISSTDGGASFSGIQKLGNQTWPLNGCPMDGGGISLNKDGEVQTIWRRQSKLYTCVPGQPEHEIGEGRGCTIETINNKNIYAWTDNGNIILVKPDGKKTIIGKGIQPILKTLDDKHLICVWENEKQIHAEILTL